MFYDYAITVPANTLESEPVSEVLKLCQGVIQRIEVQFPIGTLALMHCKIYHHEQQAFPSNPEGDFASDGYVIPIDEFFELNSEPYELKVTAWNLDDTYQHILTIRIGILRPEDIEKSSGLLKALKRFFRLVGLGG